MSLGIIEWIQRWRGTNSDFEFDGVETRVRATESGVRGRGWGSGYLTISMASISQPLGNFQGRYNNYCCMLWIIQRAWSIACDLLHGPGCWNVCLLSHRAWDGALRRPSSCSTSMFIAPLPPPPPSPPLIIKSYFIRNTPNTNKTKQNQTKTKY